MKSIAISSVFGDPLNVHTWSGAPANVARGLLEMGILVDGIRPVALRPLEKIQIAATDMACGLGRPVSSEQIYRGRRSRRLMARQVVRQARRLGVRHVLHTGTFDLSAERDDGLYHYLYCDHTWALTQRYHLDVPRYNKRALAEFEEAEWEAVSGLTHIFTFGDYVRDNLINHYRVPPYRVTTVGSGMGAIEPYPVAKAFIEPRLLFVAKHLWQAKGGPLLMDAFKLARQRIPHLSLDIVGGGNLDDVHPGVRVHKQLPWKDLQQLYREASLLVQPMLNDPWGQVYLEAMASSTPVMGLRRNGLPELTDNGRHGFLIDRADPKMLADAIVDALSSPARLSAMAQDAQRFVGRYSWANVARQVARELT